MVLKVNYMTTETACEGKLVEAWYKLLADDIHRRKKQEHNKSDEEAEEVGVL